MENAVEDHASPPGTSAVPRGAAEPPWPRASLAQAFMLVMLLAATFSFVHRYLPSVLVDPIKREMGITDVQFSLLQGTAFAVLYGAASLLCGLLADRVHRRNLVVLGVIIWTVGTVLFGLSTSFSGLLASRAMVGLGEATLGPASVSMLCDYFRPERRGRAIAVSFFGATLGSALAFAAGGRMLDAAAAGQFAGLPWVGELAPWRQVVVLMGASGFVLVPAILTFPEPQRRAQEVAEHLGNRAQELWALRGRIVPVVLAGATVALADFGFSIWATALLTRTHGFSVSDAGSVLGACMLIAGVGGGWLGGVLCDRAHVRSPLTGRIDTVVLAAIAMLLSSCLLLLPGGWAAVAAFACWQVAANAAYVGCASTLQDQVSGRTRGIAAALSLCMSIGFGLGLGPTSVAALNQQIGGGGDALSTSLLIVLLVAGFATLVCAGWLRRRLARQGLASSNA
ncbi:MAG: MFS transporter [Rubrivivax sp.]|jgi:MFS family permease|nr:MFS transporter [Rubrivivax sp.]